MRTYKSHSLNFKLYDKVYQINLNICITLKGVRNLQTHVKELQT